MIDYPELREDALVERQLRNAAAVAARQSLGGAVSAAHADALRQDLLQLGRRASCDQRPDQRQRVVVEVRLHTRVHNVERLHREAENRNHFSFLFNFAQNIAS